MDGKVRDSKLFIVEHLDPELEEWSALEYKTIAEECYNVGSRLLLSSVPQSLRLPNNLAGARGLEIDHESVEVLFPQNRHQVCLLDPAAQKDLSPEDEQYFDAFLFGGILGDDPPRDRTSELRKMGFEGRRLGPVQMTTDTAVRVTRMVLQDQITLSKIPYIDHPELKLSRHETIQMPFRYVKNDHGNPVMPEGMFDLIKNDTEKDFGN